METAWNIIGMLGALTCIGFFTVATYRMWKDR